MPNPTDIAETTVRGVRDLSTISGMICSGIGSIAIIGTERKDNHLSVFTESLAVYSPWFIRHYINLSGRPRNLSPATSAIHATALTVAMLGSIMGAVNAYHDKDLSDNTRTMIMASLINSLVMAGIEKFTDVVVDGLASEELKNKLAQEPENFIRKSLHQVRNYVDNVPDQLNNFIETVILGRQEQDVHVV